MYAFYGDLQVIQLRACVALISAGLFLWGCSTSPKSDLIVKEFPFHENQTDNECGLASSNEIIRNMRASNEDKVVKIGFMSDSLFDSNSENDETPIKIENRESHLVKITMPKKDNVFDAWTGCYVRLFSKQTVPGGSGYHYYHSSVVYKAGTEEVAQLYLGSEKEEQSTTYKIIAAVTGKGQYEQYPVVYGDISNIVFELEATKFVSP